MSDTSDDDAPWRQLCVQVRHLMLGRGEGDVVELTRHCQEVKALTRQTWPSHHADILAEMRLCTRNTSNQRDYQRFLLECLCYPYHPAYLRKHDPLGRSLPLFVCVPSALNDIDFSEGQVTEVERDGARWILQAWACPTPTKRGSSLNVTLRFDGVTHGVFDDDLLCRSLSSLVELPLIDAYREPLGAPAGRDQRCVLIEDFDPDGPKGLLLFDHLDITVLPE
jgi:hypothetical protein